MDDPRRLEIICSALGAKRSKSATGISSTLIERITERVSLLGLQSYSPQQPEIPKAPPSGRNTPRKARSRRSSFKEAKPGSTSVPPIELPDGAPKSGDPIGDSERDDSDKSDKSGTSPSKKRGHSRSAQNSARREKRPDFGSHSARAILTDSSATVETSTESDTSRSSPPLQTIHLSPTVQRRRIGAKTD